MATAIGAALTTRPSLQPHKTHLSRFSPNTARFPFQHVSVSSLRVAIAGAAADGRAADTSAAEKKEEQPFKVLLALKTQYNDGILVIDSPTSKYLLLDSSRNVHSMLNKEDLWTGSYWDEFASLPSVIPPGPIALLGLGAGTAAHIILNLYPSLHLLGWELDEMLINVARLHFDLSKIETPNEHGGRLSAFVGDALSPDVSVEGGFAGIIVDLFSDGNILPQLLEEETWVELSKKLMQNGRIMVNCSGRDKQEYYRERKIAPMKLSRSWTENSCIKTLNRALPGQVCWKLVEETDCENYFAMTGPLPDLETWSGSVPDKLSSKVKDWKLCE
ncbi:hypothetical protein LUZ60_014636 [Juncus effusus]|nr:hypothetical protein LUZ60_014636 [Juncus effusus]